MSSGAKPSPTDQDGYGTMTVEFLTCNEGRVTYDFPSPGLSGAISIWRIVDDDVAPCEALR